MCDFQKNKQVGCSAAQKQTATQNNSYSQARMDSERSKACIVGFILQ